MLVLWSREVSSKKNWLAYPIFGKKCCAFVREIGARSAFPLPKKRNIIFRIGNDPPPHSEVFRKFIEFGPGSHPLVSHTFFRSTIKQPTQSLQSLQPLQSLQSLRSLHMYGLSDSCNFQDAPVLF